jgi:hypothetical protein
MSVLRAASQPRPANRNSRHRVEREKNGGWLGDFDKRPRIVEARSRIQRPSGAALRIAFEAASAGVVYWFESYGHPIAFPAPLAYPVPIPYFADHADLAVA